MHEGAKACMLQVKKALSDHGYINDVILFSSLKKTGIKEARNALNRTFSNFLDHDE